MVKKIDSKSIDDIGLYHIGWALWKATAAWKRRFEAAMREAGYPAFAEARGAILMHVGEEGIAQSELVARTGLTKQAVQQALELLEDEDLVRRAPDPADSRRRIVARTEAGRAAYAAADRIKRQIDAEIEVKIGESKLEEFLTLAARIAILLSADAPDAAGATIDPAAHEEKPDQVR